MTESKPATDGVLPPFDAEVLSELVGRSPDRFVQRLVLAMALEPPAGSPLAGRRPSLLPRPGPRR